MLQTGSLVINIDLVKQSDCTNCAIVHAQLNNRFQNNAQVITRVFINGFDLDQKSAALQVSLSPTNLLGTNLTIKATMGPMTVINRISLSWLAFSPATASFASYGGQISLNRYSGSQSQDISRTIHQSKYTIYGMNLISITSGKGITFHS